MSKLFTENGFLTEYGKAVFAEHLDKEVQVILNEATSPTEAKILGSLIAKRVGDMVSEHALRLNDPILQMSDLEFENHLKAKYGDQWNLVGLEGVELRRLKYHKLSPENFQKVEEEMKRLSDMRRNNPGVQVNNDLRYRG